MLEWDVGTADLQRSLRRLQQKLGRLSPGIQQELASVITVGLEEAKTWMIVNKLTGGTTRTRLALRSRNLVRSIAVRVRRGGGQVVGDLHQDQRFKSRVYGPVHEFGATIRPRRAKYLTVPLTEDARQRPITTWRGLFFFRSRKGNLLAGISVGERVFPLYVLLKQVRIPARPFFAPTAKKFLPLIVKRMGAEVRRLVRSEAP